MTEWPDTPPARPLWLVTLADLALLLVGFFVLLQSNRIEPASLARSLRTGFAGPVADAPMAVAATRIDGFAPRSAALPNDPAALAGWARTQLADPRVTLTVTGAAGLGGDVDPVTGSATLLATDRARAVAAVIAPIAPARVLIATTAGPPAVTVTLAFAGEPLRTRP